MRSRFEGLTFRCTAAMMSGLLALTTVGPALAQGKPAKPVAAPAKPAKPAGQPAKPAAKPAKDATAKPKLTDKQKKDEAKKAYKAGEDKFGKADYAGALTSYQDADDLFPGAQPKYKIAVCLDKMNKVPEAVDAYQKFLDTNPDADKFKDKIADAKTRGDALKKTPGKIKLATDPAMAPNLKVTVDGAPKAGTEFAVDPGHHTLVASADNFDPTTQEFDLKWSESKDLQVKLNAAAPKPVPPPPVVPPPPPPPVAALPPPKTEAPPERHSNTPAYVTLGLAVVGAGVGTVFGVQALGSKSDYNKADGSGHTRDQLDKVERQSLLADMSYAVALTFGVTGIVLLLSNDDAPKAGATAKPATAFSKPIVAPYVTPTGGGAAATLRF